MHFNKCKFLVSTESLPDEFAWILPQISRRKKNIFRYDNTPFRENSFENIAYPKNTRCFPSFRIHMKELSWRESYLSSLLFMGSIQGQPKLAFGRLTKTLWDAKPEKYST